MSDKTGAIKKNSKICGHCKWIKSVNGSWRCNNPASRRFRDDVAYAYSPCDYFESLHRDNSKIMDKENASDDEITVADVVVEPDEKPTDQIKQTVSGDVEQISKNVTVGRVEIEREDDRNVIYAIINAISVRINMPRGTVKALMACLAVLIIAALIYGADVLHSWNQSRDKNSINKTEEVADNAGSNLLPAKDVVISKNYSYTIPEGYTVEEPELQGIWFSNCKAYGLNDDKGDFFRVESYIAAGDGGDIKDVVLDRLKATADAKDITHEYIETDFGTVLAYSFDFVSAESKMDTHAVEYSWADDDGTICSLFVSSESEELMDKAKTLLASVHRSDNDYSNDELLTIDVEHLIISPNYRYHLPDGVFDIEGPYNEGVSNEYYCEFIYDKVHYVIHSYAFTPEGGDLKDAVLDMLSYDETADIDSAEILSSDFGDILRVEFEAKDMYDITLKVTGFFWYDSDSTICCLEVASDKKRNTEVEDMVRGLVYKTPVSNNTEPGDEVDYEDYYDYQKAYEDQMKEEAMNSMAEDAMRDYYEPEPEKTYPW